MLPGLAEMVSVETYHTMVSPSSAHQTPSLSAWPGVLLVHSAAACVARTLHATATALPDKWLDNHHRDPLFSRPPLRLQWPSLTLPPLQLGREWRDIQVVHRRGGHRRHPAAKAEPKQRALRYVHRDGT